MELENFVTDGSLRGLEIWCVERCRRRTGDRKVYPGYEDSDECVFKIYSGDVDLVVEKHQVSGVISRTLRT